MELHELIERVDSRETFLEFLVALRADLDRSGADEHADPSSPYGPRARGWENPTLERYLEAMHSWTEATGNRISEPPVWRTFADILYAAKIYE